MSNVKLTKKKTITYKFLNELKRSRLNLVADYKLRLERLHQFN